MTALVASILGVVFILIVAVFYLQIQDNKKIKAKNNSMNKQVREIQADYRLLVTPLYTDNIVNGGTKQRIISLVTNFFVYQPVNEINIDRLIAIYETSSSIFEQCLLANNQYPEQFPEVFSLFIKSIPVSARDFGANFYNNTLPTIFDNFSSALEALSDPIDEDDIDENNMEDDQENSGEALQTEPASEVSHKEDLETIDSNEDTKSVL